MLGLLTQGSSTLGQLYQGRPTHLPRLSNIHSPRVLWVDFKPSEDHKSGLLTCGNGRKIPSHLPPSQRTRS